MYKNSVIIRYLGYLLLISAFVQMNACNYAMHRTMCKSSPDENEEREAQYEISLDDDYQDFVTYIFLGNRNENFSTYFNKFFSSQEDFDDGMTEYKTLIIANYNRRLDSINALPVLTTNVKDKLNSVIVQCSKIIQYNKNSRFLDASVLLIGKSYYFLQDYFQAERKFNEFLSKLNMSKLSDEALLYLGVTKLRLKKEEEAFSILNNLINKSENTDIKSETYQELALYAISKKDYKLGIEFIQKSIDLTNNKNNKAEKEFLLARLLESTDLQKADEEYLKVLQNTSDFDLKFYANLNHAKVLDIKGKYSDAYIILEDMTNKYREYPELRQLADIEIANNLHYQKKFKESLIKYFDVIINYPNTKSSAEAYYKLGKHYEEVEKNYLNALVNYKKVNEQISLNDFADFTANRVNTFNRYFDLMATINDTVKGEIPQDNLDLEKYREKIEEEKGIKKENIKGKEFENKNPKGGGYKEALYPNDSIKGTSSDTSMIINKSQDDSLTLLINKLKEDSLKIIQQLKEDSLKASNLILKEENKFMAYLDLSELFTYELNKPDSAEYYIDKAINFTNDLNKQTKAYFFLATLYKITERQELADSIFNKIILSNPNSIFANESRKNLNLPVIDIEKDDAENEYKIAESKIVTGQYPEALKLLEDITNRYSTSKYVPKSLYTIGWIYENIYSKKDSMILYYKRLQKEYPQSEYTISINDKITFFSTIEEDNKKDSLRLNSDTLSTKKDSTFISNDTLNTNIEKELIPDENMNKQDTSVNLQIESNSEMPKK